MATNLDLDDRLVREVQKLGKFKTKKEAVNTALREYARLHKQAALIELFGKIDYAEGHEYKKLRARRRCAP